MPCSARSKKRLLARGRCVVRLTLLGLQSNPLPGPHSNVFMVMWSCKMFKSKIGLRVPELYKPMSPQNLYRLLLGELA